MKRKSLGNGMIITGLLAFIFGAGGLANICLNNPKSNNIYNKIYDNIPPAIQGAAFGGGVQLTAMGLFYRGRRKEEDHEESQDNSIPERNPYRPRILGN